MDFSNFNTDDTELKNTEELNSSFLFVEVKHFSSFPSSSFIWGKTVDTLIFHIPFTIIGYFHIFTIFGTENLTKKGAK